MSNKENYDKIMQIYDERRFNNYRIEMERFEEVCRKIPGFRDIASPASQIDTATIDAIISGDQSFLTKAKESIASVESKKSALLAEYGFAPDYLDHIYDCPDCQDTGFSDGNRCHCFQKELLKILYSQSNLSEQLKTDNFSNFNTDYYPDDYVDPSTNLTPRDNIIRVLNICNNFITHFKENNDNLLFYGHAGCGKTFLSSCIAKELLDKGYSVIYLTSSKLFDILEMKTFRRDEMDNVSSGIYDMLYLCDVLIIDDLGSENMNSFTESKLFSCIQERLLNNVSTIISTNLSLLNLKDYYGERIFSRFVGYYTNIRLYGKDIRIEKLNNNGGES